MSIKIKHSFISEEEWDNVKCGICNSTLNTYFKPRDRFKHITNIKSGFMKCNCEYSVYSDDFIIIYIQENIYICNEDSNINYNVFDQTNPIGFKDKLIVSFLRTPTLNDAIQKALKYINVF